MTMKVRLLLEVYAPNKCDFEKDVELDFLPTEGLSFHLVDIPNWGGDPMGGTVDNVQIFMNEEPYFAFVTFRSEDLSHSIKNDEEWNIFANAFVADGWHASTWNRPE